MCSRHGDVDKDTWEFYPVVGAHALLELMKCQQVSAGVSLLYLPLTPGKQRLSTEMTRLKEIKDKQLKQLQVPYLSPAIISHVLVTLPV